MTMQKSHKRKTARRLPAPFEYVGDEGWNKLTIGVRRDGAGIYLDVRSETCGTRTDSAGCTMPEAKAMELGRWLIKNASTAR